MLTTVMIPAISTLLSSSIHFRHYAVEQGFN